MCHPFSIVAVTSPWTSAPLRWVIDPPSVTSVFGGGGEPAVDPICAAAEAAISNSSAETLAVRTGYCTRGPPTRFSSCGNTASMLGMYGDLGKFALKVWNSLTAR